MSVVVRGYEHEPDYARVGAFLVRTYRASGSDLNWLAPRWEYMHFHSFITKVDLRPIGIWEADGEIVTAPRSASSSRHSSNAQP
jgi:hypothetical protein